MRVGGEGQVWHQVCSERRVDHSSSHICRKRCAAKCMAIRIGQKGLNDIFNVRVCSTLNCSCYTFGCNWEDKHYGINVCVKVLSE